MKEACEKVPKIVSAEMKIIKKHLEKHKYYHHLKNDNDGIMDFAKQYAWVMREAYCHLICENKKTCKVIPLFKIKPLPDISNKALRAIVEKHETNKNLINVEFKIIKKHIVDHKWFHHISNYDDAVKHFLKHFGWIIKELYENNPIKNISKE